MGALENIDAKLKHLRAIEATYKQEVRWADADIKRDPENRRKYERTKAKSEKKMTKVMRKIHIMVLKRERVKARLKE